MLTTPPHPPCCRTASLFREKIYSVGTFSSSEEYVVVVVYYLVVYYRGRTDFYLPLFLHGLLLLLTSQLYGLFYAPTESLHLAISSSRRLSFYRPNKITNYACRLPPSLPPSPQHRGKYLTIKQPHSLLPEMLLPPAIEN